MDKILQFTCLKLHFQGVEVFAPVLQAGGHYTLQSVNRILCGVRGNEFNFTSLITAKSWIDDNLAKLAKAGKTSEAYLLDLIIAQNATPQVWLAEEIATIELRASFHLWVQRALPLPVGSSAMTAR